MTEFSHIAPHQMLRALTLSGGGVRGLLSIAILAELRKLTKETGPAKFDLLCGTSIGGIVCLGLAIQKTPEQIAQHFLDKIPEIFGNARRWNPFCWRGAKHDPSQLRTAISEILGRHSSRLISNLDWPVVIVSVNASQNALEYFGNVDISGGKKCIDAPLIDIAMATSAAPLYFPPHKISENYFLDGGLVSNNPDLEAFQVATDHFCRTAQSLKILSIGTGRSRPQGPSQVKPNPGLRSWLGPLALVDRTMHLQEQKPSNFVLSRLDQNYFRIDPVLSEPCALDDCRPETLNSLLSVAREAAEQSYAQAPARLAGFLR